MKAQTDLVYTRDRSRIVPIGNPDGDSFAWVASKGEEVPGIGVPIDTDAKANLPAESKQRKPKDNK
jgi:hypothetical protein